MINTEPKESIEAISQAEFWPNIILQSPFWKEVFEGLLGHEYIVEAVGK